MLLAAAMLVPAALGLGRYVITGDSMDGSIDRGSIAYAQAVPVEDLRVGDVITYDPPGVGRPEGLVTHRIVSIRRVGGEQILRTKGDANATADPWRFQLEGPLQARIDFHVPYLGYGFAALGVRWVRMLLIGLPALLLAVAVLAGLWRQAGAELGVDATRSEPEGAS